MNKLLSYLPIFALLLFSCDDIDDTYVTEKLYDIDWNTAADNSSATLIERFWNASQGYFNYENDGLNIDFNYNIQPHAMDVIIDAYIRTNNAEYKSYFDSWYVGIKQKNGNTYLSHSYEEMESVALTMLRLYDVTKEEKYLQTAQVLWLDIENGWNNLGGGGIALNKEELAAKNTCSNAPAVILAARLYNYTKNDKYKTWAFKIYNWQKTSLFDPASGAVYEGLNGDNGSVATITLSNNQGTFLGAAYELYKITNDYLYLLDARRAAHYGVKNPGMLDTGNNVIRDEGKGIAGLYKGTFMRYLTPLLLEDNLDASYRELFIIFHNNNANVLWRRGVDKENILYGSNWTQVVGNSTELTSQISGCTMIETKAYYERLKR